MAQGSNQEKQDRRVNSAMEDNNAMTIEFLRARLLAERAVSKSARDKADELAQRVAELEEQLKIVFLQRKKAEKATADVLAILEENGFADISETFDSSSEHESFSETQMDKNSTEVEENLVDSKVRNEAEELSASEYDSFPLPGRSLSWKGRENEPNSSKKFKEPLMRRRISSESVYFSSPKPRQGKSCRQIKRRESRSVAEARKTDRNMVDFQENGVGASSEYLPRATEEMSNKVIEGSELQGEKDLNKVLNSKGFENETNVHINMERALEHQAQLIGRFEDMERAQREWEKKFRENNICNPDSYDPGNHSDVTEESNETKTQAQHQGVSVVSLVQEARSAAEGVQFLQEPSKSQSHVLYVDSEPSKDNKPHTSVPESVGQDFKLTGGTGKHNRDNLENKHSHLHSSNHHLYGHSSCTNQSDFISPLNSDGSSCKEEASSIHKGPHVVVPQETSYGCGSVLEALKQARLSLQEKVCSLPLPKAGSVAEALKPSLPTMRMTTGTLTTEPVFTREDTEPSSYATEVRHMVEVPVECAGLFRVPTDLSAEALKKNNCLGSRSCLSLGNHYPDTGVTLSSSGRLFTEVSHTNLLRSSFPRSLTNNFPDIGAPLTAGDRLSTTPYVGGSLFRSSFPTDDPLRASAQLFKPYKGMPSVSESPVSFTASACTGNDSLPSGFYSGTGPRTYTGTPNIQPPSSSSLPSYPDFMQRSEDRFPTLYHSQSVGIPHTYGLSNYDGNFRPNRYK